MSTKRFKIRGPWKYFGNHQTPAFVVKCKVDGTNYVFYDYTDIPFIGLYEREEAEILFRTTVDIPKLKRKGISQIYLHKEVFEVDKCVNHIMSYN